MSGTLQEFLAGAIEKAAVDLETALLRLPEDERNWKAAETSRSALDQVAECALINGSAVDLIHTRKWPDTFDFAEFERQKLAQMGDWDSLQALLHTNTARVAEAVRATPDADLGVQIQMPFGPMTLAQVLAYPYWNMSYHEGQINFIASMVGALP